jgi:ElaB/YqjD/DUF883 family membrane-anchored ribosome-binding protein
MASRTDLTEQIDRNVARLGTHVRELEELTSDVGERFHDALTLEHQVRERPWTMLVAAVAAGFLLERMLR